MSQEIIVRMGRREDMPEVLEMIKELCEYEGIPGTSKLTVEDLQRDAFDLEHPAFISIVAECAATKQLVGHVLCNFAYSSWTGLAMYLEDLYVKPEWRSKKVGHLLFKEMCKVARDKKCHRIDWHCLLSNELAVRFYEARGSFDVCKAEGRTCYRICEKKILKIANDN